MSAIAFDTLRFSKRLRSGGYTEEQADALAEAYAEAVSDGVASKADLQLAAEKANSELQRVADKANSELQRVAEKLSGEIQRVAENASAELREAIGGVDAKIDAKFGILDNKIDAFANELRIEIRDTKISLIKWFVPMLLGQTAMMAALVKLL